MTQVKIQEAPEAREARAIACASGRQFFLADACMTIINCQIEYIAEYVKLVNRLANRTANPSDC
jgi:hypothetical protein